jgi:hypothetical protein
MALKPFNSPGGYSVGDLVTGASNVILANGDIVTSTISVGAAIIASSASPAPTLSGFGLISTTGAGGNIRAGGNLIANANVIASSIIVSSSILAGIASPAPTLSGFGLLSTTGADGNIIASGNLIANANVIAAGNISGTYLLGNGAFLTGVAVASTYGNSNVADYLASNSNVTITVGTGAISTQGNVTSGNINITSDRIAATGGTIRITPNSAVATSFVTISSTDGPATISTAGSITTSSNVSGGGLVSTTFGANIVASNTGFPIKIRPAASYANSEVKFGLLTDGGATFNTIEQSGGSSEANAGGLLLGNLNLGAYALINGYTDQVNGAGPSPYGIDFNTGPFAGSSNTSQGNVTFATRGGGSFNVSMPSVFSRTITSNANITTTANISGGYILGNGAFLTGLAATYSNANVANYLPTYTGNLSGGNLSLTGDAVITGNLDVKGNVTYIESNVVTINDVNITLANNATNATQANGGGITINGADLTLQYLSASNTFALSHTLTVANNISATGNVSGALVQASNVVANAYFQVGATRVGQASVTTTSTSTQAVANVTIGNAVEFFVKGVDDSTASIASMATIHAISDGTVLDYTQFGGVQLGGGAGTLTVTQSGTGIVLQVTPTSSNSMTWTTQYKAI